ncbi:MAG: hypothetical protein ACFFF9_12115 [Candidatus Thorarchaeota archaeon]
MQVTITGDIGVAILVGSGVLLLLGAMLLERIMKRYFEKCIRKGMKEYSGRRIKHLSEDEMETWQRVYMLFVKKPRRIGIYVQLPYYIAFTYLAIVSYIPMAMGGAPWLILFPIWMIILTIASLGRASQTVREFEEMKK